MRFPESSPHTHRFLIAADVSPLVNWWFGEQGHSRGFSGGKSLRLDLIRFNTDCHKSDRSSSWAYAILHDRISSQVWYILCRAILSGYPVHLQDIDLFDPIQMAGQLIRFVGKPAKIAIFRLIGRRSLSEPVYANRVTMVSQVLARVWLIALNRWPFLPAHFRANRNINALGQIETAKFFC